MKIKSTAPIALALALAAVNPAMSKVVKTGVPGMLLDHDVAVTMSDGARLSVNVYRPDKPGRYPVLMLMGPYGKDTPMADAPAYKTSWAKLVAKYPDLCSKSSCRFIRFEAPDPERWVPNDYIVVHADVRGAGKSPGMLDPLSPRETEDYSTLITWAAHQSWSNGKVGLLGTSYQAINQYQVAARQPQGLAAILPWEGAFDEYREIAYAGGMLNVAWKFWFDNQVATNQNGQAASPLVDMNTGEKSTGSPLPEPLLKQNRTAPIGAIASHPFDGAYYAERHADPSRITVPMLAVANWAGWSTAGYLAAPGPNKWLRIESGDHLSPFYSDESIAVQKRFFDHFLKDADNGWDKEPKVEIQVRRPDGATWRAETAWPIPSTRWQRFNLDASAGSMSPEAVGAASSKSYPGLADGLTFTTTPFERETEFTGPVGVHVWVASSLNDMDVFAAVRLIDPQGRDVAFMGNSDANVPLAIGFLRVSHRAVDPARSTEWMQYHPHTGADPMQPGEFYPVDLEFANPMSIVVPKGYRLALTIGGKDFGYPPGSNTVHANDYPMPNTENSGLYFAAHPNRDPKLYGGTNTIATGGDRPSYLLLPRIGD